MADVRRYDPGQGRDPDGKWGDGVPGPSTDFFDMAGFNDVVEVEGTFGDLAMGTDEAGDVRVAFRDRGDVVELDLGADELAGLSDALDELVGERDDLPDDANTRDIYYDADFGHEDSHRVELYGSGVIAVRFGAKDDDDPPTLRLDPPDAGEDGDGSDDVTAFLDAISDVLSGNGEARSADERKFNPSQQRDPNGEWGDGVAGSSALKDALKLAGKIDLAPDETLVGSGKLDGEQGGIRLALTERDGRQMLRIGIGGEGYGQRNRDEGVAAWDGNPSPAPLSSDERQRLEAEDGVLSEEYDSASPERQGEIEDERAGIRERLVADDQGFNGTANIDEYSARRLADRIRPALAEAVEQEKTQNAAWDEIEALEAKGDFDPARMAELRRIARADETDYITFDSGVVAGSEWGDVHFSVELDDPGVGAYVKVGVAPKGAPDDWGDGQDWMATLNAAETRKFLRLLERLTPAASSRSRIPKGVAVPTRSFQPEEHPRAPAGSDTGGQFAAGGGQKKTTPKRGPRRRPTNAGNGVLAYDAGSGQGTGYDSKDGDPQVHDLQQALNRLGITDSAGKALKDDGKLGPKTTAAVKKLQTQLGLKPDGKVTPALLAQIKSMKSLPAKRSAFMDVCVRAFNFEFESRSRTSDGRTLEGYAAVFNSPTRIAAVGGDFDEVISPGAFTRSIRSRMPVLQFEHGRDPRVGAVPIGAIEDLSEDSQGLHVRATLFDNPVVEPVRQAIAGRAIKGMSFRFNVVDGGDQWQRRSGAIDLRTVGDADVHELGPVVFPAYDSTTVSVRSLLAQLGPEEHRTLLQELAYDLRSLEPEHIAGRPTARSSGGGDTDKDDGPAEEHLSIRQRLDHGALRTRGILK